MLIYAMFDILACLHDFMERVCIRHELSMVHDVVYDIRMSL